MAEQIPGTLWIQKYGVKNEQFIWQYLRSTLGFSAAGAAGVMGNMYVESGLCQISLQSCQNYNTYKNKPIQQYCSDYWKNIKNMDRTKFIYDAPCGSGLGVGLPGWDQYRGTSFKAYVYDYCAAGNDMTDIGVSMNFFARTLTDYVCTNYGVSRDVLKLPNILKQITNVDEATRKFESLYENAGAPHMPLRLQAANYYYNKYKDLKISGVINVSNDQQVNMQKSELVRIATEQGEQHNKGTKYQQFCNIGSGDSWCAAFVSWCLNEAGIKGVIKQTGVQQLETEAKQKGLQEITDGTQIKAGDIVIFASTDRPYGPGGYWWQHTGIAVKDYDSSSNSVMTSEGNTGGSGRGETYSRTSITKLHKSGINSKAQWGRGFWIRTAFRLNGEGDAVIGTSNSYNDDIGFFQNFNFSWLKNLATKMSDLFKSPQGSSTTPQKSMTVSYETKTAKIRRDLIRTVDADANSIRVKGNNLLTFPSYVESPFIIVKIGNYTFGSYSKSNGTHSWEVEYPNFVTGLSVVKVNGTVNQYTINLTYQIEVGEDPNFVDKVLSTVGYGIIKISYGDWMVPNFIYKEEQAIITKVTTSVEFNRSKINYTIYCTSNALSLLGTCSNFPKKVAQPSHVIMQLLQSKQYGLTDIFPGMKSRINKLMLIPRDDQEVEIPAKKNMDVFSYINFLVTCMRSNTSSGNLNDSSYYLTMNDDVLGQYGGAYFQITKVDNKINAINLNQMNVYTVDVGYPGDTPVVNFQIRNDNSWSLLYDYNEKVAPQTYKYSINNEGQIYTESSPSIMISDVYNKPMSTQRSWWTKMTQFPINAELTIKGLLKPAMLMTYVRINSFFYGQRHISSGLYIITKQTDTVSGGGYRTSLQLTRVAGDLDYMETKYDTIEYKVPVYKTVNSKKSVKEFEDKTTTWAENKKNNASGD